MISDRTLIEGQEQKFNAKDQKLVKSRSWPELFNQKVDIRKVHMESIQPWIERRLAEYIGTEDEITSNLLISELESYQQYPCPKEISIMMTGFLSSDTNDFMMELWELLLEAQQSENGIPECLINEKKEEILLKQQVYEKEIAKLEQLKLMFSDQAGFGQEEQLQKEPSRSRSRSPKHRRKRSYGTRLKLEEDRHLRKHSSHKHKSSRHRKYSRDRSRSRNESPRRNHHKSRRYDSSSRDERDRKNHHKKHKSRKSHKEHKSQKKRSEKYRKSSQSKDKQIKSYNSSRSSSQY